MKFSLVTLAAGIATTDASASSKWANLRRRLSYQKIAGYAPGSQVCVFYDSLKLIDAWIVWNTFANVNAFHSIF